jgi:hypothetical protein
VPLCQLLLLLRRIRHLLVAGYDRMIADSRVEEELVFLALGVCSSRSSSNVWRGNAKSCWVNNARLSRLHVMSRARRNHTGLSLSKIYTHSPPKWHLHGRAR